MRFWSGLLGLLGLAAMGLPVPPRGLVERGYLAHLPMPTPAAMLGAGETPRPRDEPFIPGWQRAGGIGAYPGTYFGEKDYPAAGKALASLPLAWARTELPWAALQPRADQWHWPPWDRSVNLLHTQGYRILGLLAYWAPWTQPYSEAGYRDFERYAEAVARRYRNQIQAWEVWNEPNSGYWKGTPEQYVRLLQAAYRGVKRGNPRALVIGGATSGVDLHFVRRILRAGAASSLDRVSVHPYSFGWLPEDARLVQELRGLSRELRRHGVDGRLWVTEIGPRNARARLPDLLERTCTLLGQSGVVEQWFWFCLYVDPPNGYELYPTGWREGPAAERLRAVARREAGHRPRGWGLPADASPPWAAGSPTALAPLQAWGYGDGGSRHWLVWSPRGRVADAAGRVFDSRPVVVSAP